MSPDDLLNCSDVDLKRFAGGATPEELQSLFSAVWEKVRPLYAGQPKSIEANRGLLLAQTALTLA